MKSSLSVAASGVMKVLRQHFEAADADAAFDAGEFSGPAHYRSMLKDIDEVLTKNGWEPVEFQQALDETVSEKWVQMSGLVDFLRCNEEDGWEDRLERSSR